eukprot:11164669-Lingulodinium_polyedra.AAC.1
MFGGGSSVRPHHCAACAKPCAMMRLNRFFAAERASESRARALHARCAWSARAHDVRACAPAVRRFDRTIAR